MMVKVDNPGKGIVGKRVGGEDVNEIDNFYNCPLCGQSVDMRDLGQVLHHEARGHEALTRD